MLITRKRVGASAAFAHAHPEWMDLAAQVLFRRDELVQEVGLYDLQQAVAEALMVAYEKGKAGKSPPTPPGEHRRYTPPPVDEEIAQIAKSMRLLAWSPLSGQKAPEGYMAAKAAEYLKARAAATPTRIHRTRPAATEAEDGGTIAAVRVQRRRT